MTPTFLFYRIDKNTIVTQVDAKEWSLMVKGLVNNPLVMNYDEIKGMKSIEQYATLSCISNKIGGDLISTALWKGVRLGDILSMVKVKPEVKYIVFRCFLMDMMLDDTIGKRSYGRHHFSIRHNNVPLTAEHGYPVRA